MQSLTRENIVAPLIAAGSFALLVALPSAVIAVLAGVGAGLTDGDASGAAMLRDRFSAVATYTFYAGAALLVLAVMAWIVMRVLEA